MTSENGISNVVYLQIYTGDIAVDTLSSIYEYPTVIRVDPPSPCINWPTISSTIKLDSVPSFSAHLAEVSEINTVRMLL